MTHSHIHTSDRLTDILTHILSISFPPRKFLHLPGDNCENCGEGAGYVDNICRLSAHDDGSACSMPEQLRSTGMCLAVKLLASASLLQ